MGADRDLVAFHFAAARAQITDQLFARSQLRVGRLAAIKIADYVYVLSSGKNDIEGDRSAFQGDLGTMVRGWLGV